MSFDTTTRPARTVGAPPSRTRTLVTRGVLPYAIPVVLGGLAIALADSLSRSVVNQGTELFLLALLAIAWNVVGGYGGQFSLGHQVFVGIGAYTLVVVLSTTALPLPLVLIAAGALSALTGVVLGYPMLRLRGPYFAIGTLGIALAVTAWMMNWPFTKASQAYPLPMRSALGFAELFQLSALLLTLGLIAVTLLVSSPLGLRLVALRDDEFGAQGLGVRRVRTMLPVWALSGFMTGIVGALFALQQGSVTPSSAFSMSFALDAIVICVVGGLGTLYGPLIGAVLVFALRQYTADFAEWAMLVEALIVVLIVRLVPGGLWGVIRDLVLGVRRRIRARTAKTTRDDRVAPNDQEG